VRKNKPASPNRRRWYQLWLNIHLYLGLNAGLIFVLAGLTGSLLVFYVELDELINPQLKISQTQAQQAPQAYEAIYQALQQAHSGRNGAWRLEIPRHDRAMMMARYYKAKEKGHLHFAPLIAWVNPYTAEVVSSRFWGDYLMTWIYDLHYELLLDKTGKIIMGIIGVLLLISTLIGVYLWRPKTGKFKAALSFKANASRERFHYDLHKVSGMYSLIVLLILIVSGVILELPDYINPIINKLSPLHKADKVSSMPLGDNSRIPVDDAVSVAHKLYPNAQLRWIETPSNPKDAYFIRFYQDGEPSIRFPKTTVWIDQYSGKPIWVNDPVYQSAGDTFLNWMHPLHSGEIAGMAGRVIVLLSGLVPAILFCTGFVRWRQKRGAKIRTRASLSR
jgi:uncharacterized iron-regulated membrane protein